MQKHSWGCISSFWRMWSTSIFAPAGSHLEQYDLPIKRCSVQHVMAFGDQDLPMGLLIGKL